MSTRLLSRSATGVALILALAVQNSWACAQEIATLKPEGLNAPTCVAFSPDGKAIVMGSFFNSVAVWDVEKKRERYSLPGNESAVAAVVFSPDGKFVLAGNSNNQIKIWDTATKEAQKDLLGHEDGVTALVFSLDGKTLISGSRDGTIKLWDFASRKNLKTFKAEGMRGSYHSLAVSPDGKYIAGAEFFGNVDMFDDNGKLVLSFKQADSCAVAFSSDSKLLANAGAKSGVIKVTDLSTKETAAELKGHTEGITSLVFTPKGTLISASVDMSVKVWDVKAEKEINSLKGHTKAIKALALTKDGATLASASDDGTVKLWDIAKAMK